MAMSMDQTLLARHDNGDIVGSSRIHRYIKLYKQRSDFADCAEISTRRSEILNISNNAQDQDKEDDILQKTTRVFWTSKHPMQRP